MIKSYSRLKKQNKEHFRIPRNAQDIVGMDTVYKDGIFKIGNCFSKSYRFLDVNYSIASKEQKTNLFLDYGELLNSLDSSTVTKISINNRKIDLKQFKEDILIPMQNDRIDVYRKEYNEMLLEKIAESDDIMQEKYITITIFRNKVEDARSFFSRCTSELNSHFSKLGSGCCELNAYERLKILHDFYRSGEEENFYFDIHDFARKGHSFKDLSVLLIRRLSTTTLN